MPLTIEIRSSEERVTIVCKGQVLVGNEIEHLLSMLESICVENKSIVLDLSSVGNLDISNLAPLVTLAENSRARGGKFGFAQFRGRVRQQLLCSQALGKFLSS